MSSADTIYALSSGSLPSGVAVVRLSGTGCAQVLEDLCGSIPPARHAALRSIRDGNGHVLDRGLVLFFPAPASFTGEDCAEFQLHGGKAVVNALLDHLSSMDGLRHAEAGEFSKRAFLNVKLDLVEVEGLADLITAETEMQRRLALEHSSGALSALYQAWAVRLTHARAMIEAELDFADEDDVPGSVSSQIWQDMRALSGEIEGHLRGAGVAEIIRDGLNVVIAGLPNAGKSSLLNKLAQRDIAIVTDIAGTTRDVLSVDLSLAGFTVKLFDTAGLRDTQEAIEIEGIRRAHATLAQADIILLLSESPEGFTVLDGTDHRAPVFRIATKIDRNPVLWNNERPDVRISAHTGEGMDQLLSLLTTVLPDVSGTTSFALPTRRRHIECLKQAQDAISASLATTKEALDLQAELLRVASDALGKITGRVDVENLLDVIFSEFCIGK